MAKPLSRIELLKQKLAEEKQKKDSGGQQFNNDIYPFWTMKTGESARVRILPDKNEDNASFFFIDRLEHKISINGEDKRIPCRSMHGEDCPICDLSRKYYKEEGKGSKNGKYYYRNKTSIVRVLVIEDPLPPNEETGETYEGKVMNTQFGYQLMEKIKEQISSDDLGDFTDLNEGYDFIIKKTKQAGGEYDTYSIGSQFARKPSAIDEDVQANVELVDLSTLLPKDPGFEKVYNMLQAHITGEEYHDEDDKKSGDKPAAKKEEAAPARKPVSKPVSKPVVQESVEPEEEDEEQEEEQAPPPRKTVTKQPEPEAEEDDGDNIIARLRARRDAAKK